MKDFKFVWWGDGYFVYQDGKYIGKDDQVDLVTDVAQALGAEVVEPSDEDLEAIDFDPEKARDLPGA